MCNGSAAAMHVLATCQPVSHPKPASIGQPCSAASNTQSSGGNRTRHMCVYAGACWEPGVVAEGLVGACLALPWSHHHGWASHMQHPLPLSPAAGRPRVTGASVDAATGCQPNCTPLLWHHCSVPFARQSTAVLLIGYSCSMGTFQPSSKG